MNIIGICGRAGAGKDTAADVLVKEFGYVKVAFADEIKRTIRRWWPNFTDEELWGPSEARNRPRAEYGGLTVRKAAQFIGTEVGRELEAKLWARIGIQTAKRLLDDNAAAAHNGCLYSAKSGLVYLNTDECPAGVVFTDVRFPDTEVEAIRAEGGRIWKIERPEAGLKGEAGKHISEQHVDGIVPDVTIYNDTDVADLRRAIEWIMSRDDR